MRTMLVSGILGHSRSSVVVAIDAVHMTSLTSIFSRFWDITSGLHLSISNLSSKWNWKNTAGNRWTCFGVWLPRTLDYLATNLNPRYSAPNGHNARPSETSITDGQTNRQTDGRTNIIWRKHRALKQSSKWYVRANDRNDRFETQSSHGLWSSLSWLENVYSRPLFRQAILTGQLSMRSRFIGLCVQDYKSLCAAVTICATLIT